MVKEEIRIERVIIHILDATVGMPVLSDTEIDFGSDFADFLKEHIYKIASGDDSKQCRFYEESEIFTMLEEYREEDFVKISKEIAESLYSIMNSNVEIPSADLVVVYFRDRDDRYLGILKMNLRSEYTHRTATVGEENVNEIVKFKAIFPSESQKLTEAAIIRMSDCSIRLIEKKYEVNGEKTNYFSYLFLKCNSSLSPKTKLSIVTKAIEHVQKDNLDEYTACEAHMKAKSIIQEELEKNGGFVVEDLADRVFEGDLTMRNDFQEKMEKYDMVKQEVVPQNENTIRKYQKQCLYTDTGIEIKIPMDQYKDTKSVEFLTNDDGTVSVLIKNIGHLMAKY
ncbi:MAG: nucleoid-associated protein [Lachnospiraceae bacterium]|nr:nucleoid-associated protein [Lachnospiraceae bacterium]